MLGDVANLRVESPQRSWQAVSELLVMRGAALN